MGLPDGRDLAWLELGAGDGVPVFAFHGTPGSRMQAAFDDKPVLAAGVRLIAPDRPGYGHSSYHPGRRLADWAGDVGALADHLALDRFAVIGLSGGGPHASACARFLPRRVIAAGIVSGVAPLTARGSEEGMMGANRAIVRLSRLSGAFVLPFFAAVSAAGRRWPDRAVAIMRRQAPPADADVLARPEVHEVFVRDFGHASATTARAAAQDFRLFTGDWGFDLEDITVPVHVWQGTADRNVPPAHGRLQAERIPGAVYHECPGEGHLLIVDHLEEILGTVAGRA
jgi:pimeloyl-ACP methyl ester carboxylesterase